MTDYGSTPTTGWAPLAPELLVDDLGRSLSFWCDGLGFAVAFQRLAKGFAYLERPEGAQIMLNARNGRWETGPLEPPFGRGVMLQVAVSALAPVLNALDVAGWPVHTGPREVWRRTGDRVERGSREVFVQDPDGYLIMLGESIGERTPRDD